MFVSKYSFDVNNASSSMFQTQYTLGFFVAECPMVCETLSPGGLRITPEVGRVNSIVLMVADLTV
jgi:hypothetical protein